MQTNKSTKVFKTTKYCILLVRVSTKQQDFTKQEQECFDLAVSEGYLPDHIIPISEKESGSRLSEEERSGLNRMKELIESNPNIDAVYTWEISRIARKRKVSFSVIDYLKEHKVNLIIKTPRLRLLDDDGNEQLGVAIAFSIFVTMAEVEIELLKARTQRTRKVLRSEKKHAGGRIPFGYSVNEDGYFVPNPTTAPLVVDIFQQHANGISIAQISREYKARGYSLSPQMIGHILSSSRYVGSDAQPPLVSTELFEQSQTVTEKSLTSLKFRQTNNVYFGKGIVRCPKCGKVLGSDFASTSYHCPSCINDRFSINVVDSLLWYASKQLYVAQMLEDDQRSKEMLLSKRSVLSEKIETCRNELTKLQDARTVLEQRYYAFAEISQTKYESLSYTNEKRFKETSTHLNQFLTELETIQSALATSLNKPKSLSMSELDSLGDIQKRDIIAQTIEVCFCERISTTVSKYSLYPKGWSTPLVVVVNNYSKAILSSEDLLIGNPSVPYSTTWYTTRFRRSK